MIRPLEFVALFDAFLLARVERLSHGFQRLTGADCFTQRDGLYVVTAACYAADALQSILHGRAYFLNSVLVLAWLVRSIFGDPMDDFYRRQPFLNPQKASVAWQLVRITMLFCSLPMLFQRRSPERCALVAILVAYYLAACNPLPPCKGKIREWIRSLRMRPLLAPAPSAA